jgi:hypothetical protein
MSAQDAAPLRAGRALVADPALLAIAGVAVAAIGASTVLHHAFPALLGVPRVEVPRAGLGHVLIGDAVAGALAWLCFAHARWRHGAWYAWVFLGGSTLFTGLEESLWIATGRLGAAPAGTYFFTKGGLWFLEVPLANCLAWFFIAYTSLFIAEQLLPGRSPRLHALLGALIATDLDLWIDPVFTHASHQAWIWQIRQGLFVFSIPATNFVGWFLLVLLYALWLERAPRLGARHGPLGAVPRMAGELVLLALGAALLCLCFGMLQFAFVRGVLNLTAWGL